MTFCDERACYVVRLQRSMPISRSSATPLKCCYNLVNLWSIRVVLGVFEERHRRTSREARKSEQKIVGRLQCRFQTVVRFSSLVDSGLR